MADTLTMLKSIGERVEMLSRQILKSVGTPTAKLTAVLYDEMLQHECVRDMAYMGGRPTLKSVLASDTLDTCFTAAGGTLSVVPDWDGISVGPEGRISPEKARIDRKDFQKLRTGLLDILKEHGYTVEGYLAEAEVAEQI